MNTINPKFIIGILLALGALGATLFLDVITRWPSILFPWAFIDGYSALSDRILFLTFLALLWYSSETYGLKKVTRDALYYEQRPLLIVVVKKLDGKPQDAWYLRVRNIGRGPALNVKIKISYHGYIAKLENDVSFMPPCDEKTVLFSEVHIGNDVDRYDRTALSKASVRVELYCADANNKSMTPFVHNVYGYNNTDNYTVQTLEVGR